MLVTSSSSHWLVYFVHVVMPVPPVPPGMLTAPSSAQIGTLRAPPMSARQLAVALHEWVKLVSVRQFVERGHRVCDLFCARGGDSNIWAEAGIGYYVGIDFTELALSDAEEEWERHGKLYPAEFFRLDPCMASLKEELKESKTPKIFDAVRCHAHLQDCFLSEPTAKQFLVNVGALLKPGGYFFGTCPDSSTIWLKYQKSVEASHIRPPPQSHIGRGTHLGPIVRSNSFSITFEDSTPFDHERGHFYGIKYQLRYVEDDGLPAQGQLMVHFPTLIRLAEDVGLELVDILNLDDFAEDHRLSFSQELQNCCSLAVDPKGRLVPQAREILALHAAFVFRKNEVTEGKEDS